MFKLINCQYFLFRAAVAQTFHRVVVVVSTVSNKQVQVQFIYKALFKNGHRPTKVLYK